MTTHELVWFSQAAISAGACFVFASETQRAMVYEDEHPGDPIADAAPVVACGLAVVAFGNVLTSYATAVFWPDLRDIGGILIRGALLAMAVYLAFAAPLHRNRD